MSLKTKTNAVIDLIAFVGFLLALEPRLTGTTIHEWLTLALAGILVIHLLIHWDWVINITKHFFQNPLRITRLNYVLSALIFVGFIVTVTTGLMISESVMPLFGLQHAQGFAARQIHNLASNLTLLLVAIHFGLHWDWIKNILDQIFITSFKRHSLIQSVTVATPDKQD
jgi:hypothetical protein